MSISPAESPGGKKAGSPGDAGSRGAGKESGLAGCVPTRYFSLKFSYSIVTMTD